MSTPEQEEIRRLRERVTELERKVNQLRSSNGALMVDADRREERARRIAGDCVEHGREITYLRHCASWYWQTMNNNEEARRAIVGALAKTALRLREGGGPETIPAADIAAALEKAIAAQDKPLRRQGYPTLADCLRGGGRP